MSSSTIPKLLWKWLKIQILNFKRFLANLISKSDDELFAALPPHLGGPIPLQMTELQFFLINFSQNLKSWFCCAKLH